MKKDVKIFLLHIIESIERIEDYIEGMSREDFMENIQVQDAVLRRLEIIGEAVKNIPQDFRKEYSQIPWKQIAGTRDILIHEYHSRIFRCRSRSCMGNHQKRPSRTEGEN